MLRKYMGERDVKIKKKKICKKIKLKYLVDIKT